GVWRGCSCSSAGLRPLPPGCCNDFYGCEFDATAQQYSVQYGLLREMCERGICPQDYGWAPHQLRSSAPEGRRARVQMVDQLKVLPSSSISSSSLLIIP
ncbi:hypothetical protein PFISCL1PPCAC_21250, partial [Pristionchus fissidentatus]